MNRHLAVGAAIAVAVSAVLTHTQNRKVAIDMGVVKNALDEINAQLNKVHGEFTGKLDELLARETLSDEDRAAIEELRATAQKLDDVVPDAVTEPLPDPDTAPDVDGDEPVVDPADPVSPVEDAPAPDAPAPVEDTPEAPAPETPADTGTVGDAPAGDVATETPATDDSATGDTGAADDEPTA